jgi:serine/threonine protein kinase
MLQAVNIKPGEKIKLSSGTYHIESEIGSGGFGTVFKGIKEGSYFAIKLNRIWELMPDDREDLKKRIKLEYEISNTIHSEHIVHTYSYDELNENPILVMDYCPDGCLRNKIGKPFDPDDLNRIIIQILSGLNVLHSYDIIHRDIKPENILFNRNTALLTDFGISANLKNRVTQRNIRGHSLKVFATLSYSPPEQSQKIVAFKLTGPTNDIFSFGVILYEMITEGKLPFGDIIEFKEDSEIVERRKTHGEWNAEILKKHTNNRTWIEIIEKCLNPDPRMRFQTANEVLQKLSGYKPDLINQNAIWKLIVLVGSDKGKEYNITNLSHYKNKRILTIGRVDEHNPSVNDIPVYETSSSYISLHHGTLECIIRDKTPTWYLRDGQWYSKDGVKGWYLSTNGVKVNDAKVNQFGIELKANDIIKIGKIVLKIICE